MTGQDCHVMWVALAAFELVACSGSDSAMVVPASGGALSSGGSVGSTSSSIAANSTTTSPSVGGSNPNGTTSAATGGAGTSAGGTSAATGGKSAGSTGGVSSASGSSSATGGVLNTSVSSTGGRSNTGSTSSAGGNTSGGMSANTGGNTTSSTGGKSTGGAANTGGSSISNNQSTGGSSAGGSTGTPGCNGNAAPQTSPSNGYLTLSVPLTSGGTDSREYTLDLPTGYDGKTPVPVMFAFHGTDSNPIEFIGFGYGDVRAGAAKRVLLVGPKGVQRGSYVGWIDTSSMSSNGIVQADIDFFDALVTLLKTNYCIDTRRVFTMGHSAGAFMSNQLGCIRSNILRGVGPFAGAGPMQGFGGTTCVGKVAAFIGHNPKEGDATECAQTQSGKCDWVVDWATSGWPTTQYWTKADGCSDIGAMPTAAFCSDPPSTPVADPTTCCKAYSGCDSNYPVTLCLYDHYDQWDGPHAFPTSWGAKAVTDFFLALPRVQ